METDWSQMCIGLIDGHMSCFKGFLWVTFFVLYRMTFWLVRSNFIHMWSWVMTGDTRTFVKLKSQENIPVMLMAFFWVCELYHGELFII